ncbi:hypothetical protein F441_12658 [Phytophthora nicotianae CJ01A1]|nr:hypothetical protein L915_12419 [Phytophthora nicotianae]ETL35560.1 hypothetical protein L916_12330 [Phytophthora nicotianae]ETP11896.1 hypothetical protein F441_12658 [Phytophthora nicotianae CJ01A1]
MDWVAVDKGMLSRLLYPNPVCLLSGGFICSMNATRYTANFMNQSGAVFVLNVPVRGMEELVLAIGSSTGADADKFEQLNIPICAPGGGDFVEMVKDTHDTEKLRKKQKLSRKELARQEIASAAAQSVALRDCVAHLLCRVDTVTEDDGHLLLRCTQLAGWTRRGYWDGRNFIPQDGMNVEPYLTFLGSKEFGYVMPTGSVTSPTGSADA